MMLDHSGTGSCEKIKALPRRARRKISLNRGFSAWSPCLRGVLLMIHTFPDLNRDRRAKIVSPTGIHRCNMPFTAVMVYAQRKELIAGLQTKTQFCFRISLHGRQSQAAGSTAPETR